MPRVLHARKRFGATLAQPKPQLTHSTAAQTEDVVFSPNPENNFQPTLQQIASGQYPVGADGAYDLGFFAAITVECNDVVIDLNGHEIGMSEVFNLQQNFFAVIELNSSPFLPKQVSLPRARAPP